MTRIEQIEARLAAATPGPWRACIKMHERPINHLDTPCVTDALGLMVIADAWGAERRGSNAALIAHAPDDLRYLLDENKRLRNALKVFADMACDKDEDDLCSLETSDNTGDVYDAGCFRTQNYVADLARKQLEAE